ncbi:MAG: hypothetical protein LBT56_02875 [Prevotellaceae bacterium]|jgi:hypothetical protein|nr:hypothetical protein [Prevotellaceae bacterium]
MAKEKDTAEIVEQLKANAEAEAAAKAEAEADEKAKAEAAAAAKAKAEADEKANAEAAAAAKAKAEATTAKADLQEKGKEILKYYPFQKFLWINAEMQLLFTADAPAGFVKVEK